MGGYPAEVIVGLSLAELDATVRAIDHAHHHGGFVSKNQADVARRLRRRLRDEAALALLAAAGAFDA